MSRQKNKSNQKPLLTIAIPNHNKQEHISKTINSVLNQTDKNFEFIIFDNHSTDNSWNIIKEFKNKNQYIKIFRNKTNIGMSGNWNLCSKKAKGTYLFILHADDIISPFFVTTTKKIISKYKPDTIDYTYSINDIKILKSDSIWNKKKCAFYNKKDVFRHYLSEKIQISIGTFIAKREIFTNKPFSQKYKFVSDIDFLRKIYSQEKNNIVLYQEKMLCRKIYGYLSGLYMRDDAKYNLFRNEIYALNEELLSKYNPEEGKYSHLRNEIMYAYYSSILMYIGATIYHGNFNEAKDLLNKYDTKIRHYTKKKNVLRYYKTLILFKKKEIVPQKFKDFIFYNRNIFSKYILKK